MSEAYKPIGARRTERLHDGKGFQLYPLEQGILADLCSDIFPTSLQGWRRGALALPADATHFGFVQSGELTVQHQGRPLTIGPGMYFSFVGATGVVGSGTGIVVSRFGYRGFFQIGGPIEEIGRLKYINGCTDSLLLAPVCAGDPCLNLLHFPDGIDQTSHTHSSIRVGVVASGKGVCLTPEGEYPLLTGDAFVIPADWPHAFKTEGSTMTIIAYHPDSDFGPQDEDHPMVNRTMVDGVAANRIPDIRTR